MRLTLMQAGLDINTDHDDKYEFVINISKGDIDFDKIKDWIEKRLKK